MPLHGSDSLPVKDRALVGTGRKTAAEYDGLQSGELAWVLGKYFKPPAVATQYPSSAVDFSVYATNMPRQLPGWQGAEQKRYPEGHPQAGQLRPGWGDDEARLVPHLQPNGHGPDRMQRLAYTAWVEAHTALRMGQQTIDLKAWDMFSSQCRAMDSELDYWSQHGANGGGPADGASTDLFALPDLAYALQTPPSNNDPPAIVTPMMQGLFVMERGPFLRSIGTDHRPVKIGLKPAGGIPAHYVDRHLGSDLAQKGLECLLKAHGLMNWVPDGICLSKYETGPNPQADAELDARASQLFNVAVQGPAVTMTWTHNPRLQCMPMDKVFILIVADLDYQLADDNDAKTAAATTTKAIAALDDKSTAAAVKAALQPDGSKTIGKSADTTTKTKFEEWKTKMLEFESAAVTHSKDATAASKQAYDNALTQAENKWKDYQTTFENAAGAGANVINGDFDKAAAEVRAGSRGVSSAYLSNFRLIRATSSYLAQYSHYKENKMIDGKVGDGSRLDLKIGFSGDSGGASYVVGGWCIGTVIDSAASRSMMNSVVRTAPASMALNINVNVEWWSADKLYQHYQDAESYQSTTQPKKPLGSVSQRGILAQAVNPLLSADVDAEADVADAVARAWAAAAP